MSALFPEPRPTVSDAIVASDRPDPYALTVRLDEGVPVVLLPREEAASTYEGLREVVRTQLPAHLVTIAGRASRIDVGDRDIALFDLRRLLNLLREEFQVDITGLYARPKAIHRFAERELKLKLFPVEPAPVAAPAADVAPEPEAAAEGEAEPDAAAEPDAVAEATEAPAEGDAAEVEEAARVAPEPPPESDDDPTPKVAERPTHFVQKTLRSGNSVRFDGDVVVLGDVNPGAEVVSAGNVLILGALLGVAHAGASGDEGAFVFALDMRPTQVRVARRIAIAPERKRTDREPEVARIDGDRIVIEPYAPARTPSSRGPRLFPFPHPGTWPGPR